MGVYHPKTEVNIGTLWRHAYLFNASFIFTIGKRYKKQSSDTPSAWRHIPLFSFLSIEEFKRHIPLDCQLICVELAEKSIPLNKFIHPQRAIYLLGAEDYGLPQQLLERHTVVQIPTLKPQSMNVSVAGSIVMYDRFSKEVSKYGTESRN